MGGFASRATKKITFMSNLVLRKNFFNPRQIFFKNMESNPRKNFIPDWVEVNKILIRKEAGNPIRI